jgi:hypothetical protein
VDICSGSFETRDGLRIVRGASQVQARCKFIPPSKHDKKVSHVVGGVSNDKGLGLVNVALAYVTQKALYVFSLVGRKIEPLQGSMTGLAVTG